MITPKKTVFAVSAKKAKMLKEMNVPADYEGSKLVVLEQNSKVESPRQIVDKVLAELSPDDLQSNVATWLQDKVDSELTT